MGTAPPGCPWTARKDPVFIPIDMPAERPRILLVDDDTALTGSLQRFLEGTGRFEVRVENRAPHARASAREFEPDLILLDIVMPEMDGTEVAAQLRKDPRFKEIPIIFLTGLISSDEVGGKSREIGGHPFIPKPVEPKELVREIEHYLVSPGPVRRRRVGPGKLVEILNLNLWRHENCALCEFWGAPGEVDATGSGPNWEPPGLRCEDEVMQEGCQAIVDQVLREAAAQYDVAWKESGSEES